MMKSKKKICFRCKFPKNLREFNKNASRSDGKQSICRKCSREGSRVYYGINGPKMRKQIRSSKEKRIEKGYEITVRHLSENPCTDCGEDDVLVLEFDHVRGLKNDNVSQMVLDGCGVDKIRLEMAKCEVRCANCHRRKTSLNHRRVLKAIENLSKSRT